jgi:hypothetical protein
MTLARRGELENALKSIKEGTIEHDLGATIAAEQAG